MITAIILSALLYFISIKSLKDRISMLEKKLKQTFDIAQQSDMFKLQATESLSETSTETQVTEDVHVQPLVPVSPVYENNIHSEVVSDVHNENIGSALAKVGIAILVLGVGFFLNYINNQGLLSNNIKFVMGLIAGGVLIGLGEYLTEKTKAYTQILRGGGLVVWFLTVFIGSMIYQLFTIPLALTLTLGIVIVSLIVSIRDTSETTFLIGTLGGYIVPLIAGFYSTEPLVVIQMLLYITVLNIGIIASSLYMDWMKTMAIGFICSWLVLFSFYGSLEVLGWWVQWLFTTLVGFMYLIVFIQGDIRRSKEDVNVKHSLILSVINTVLYTITSYTILSTSPLSPYLGFLIAILGAIHFVVYMYIRHTTQVSNHPSALTHMVLSIALITYAIPVQFDGSIVTMIWFIEGVIISYLASLKDFKGMSIMYVLGFGSVVAGIVHMVLFGEYTSVRETGIVVYNQYFIIWLAVIVLIQCIAYIWKKSVQREGVSKEFATSILSVVVFLNLLVQVSFIGLVSYEIDGLQTYNTQRVYTEQQKALTNIETYYAGSEQTEEQQKQIMSVYEKSGLMIENINRNFSFVYIIFFTIMTVIYLVVGLIANISTVRGLGIITLIITILQMFSLAWSLGPVYRIASFIGLGIILLIVAYVYIRYNKKNTTPAATIATLIALLFLGHVSVAQAATVDPKDWTSISSFSNSQLVSSTSSMWYISPVEASVWSKSLKSDYGDIRIVDGKNQEIPYVLVKQGQVANTRASIQNTNSQAKILENTLQSNKGISERILVLDTGKEGQVYTGLHFTRVQASKNFRKNVHVYISDTLLGATSPSWREVEQKGTVYNYTDPTGFSVEDMNIYFPNMASRYIKVRFENDESLKDKGVYFLNQIAVSGVYLMYENHDDTRGIKIENYISGNFTFSQDSKNEQTSTMKVDDVLQNTEKKSTEIYLHNIQAVTRIIMHVQAKSTNFTRDVVVQGSFDNTAWQTVTTGQIYRIDSPIYIEENLTIATPVLTYPYLRIIVQNNNDVPLSIEHTVDVSAQKIGILFKAEGVDVAILRFLIGNKNVSTPTYEIQKTLAYFNDIIPAQVTLTEIAGNPVFEAEKVHKPFGETYRNVVNGALVVFVALLAYLGYSWAKRS